MKLKIKDKEDDIKLVFSLRIDGNDVVLDVNGSPVAQFVDAEDHVDMYTNFSCYERLHIKKTE